jgi:predicted dehydrogenase
MREKYRVAVIGHTGRGNYGHGLDTVWRELPECELIAVADADERGRAEAAKRLQVPKAFADYRTMLDQVQPQIVSIGPRWADQHRDMILEAAGRGIHMYLEKPMCRSPQEADEIIEACETNRVKLAIAHQTRYSPRLRVVHDLLADGILGELLEIRGRGKEDHRGGGEDLWVLGSHVMNLIHQFGGEPQWCFAQLHQDGHPVVSEDVQPGNEGLGPLAGDTVHAMYGLEQERTAYFDSRRNAAGGRFGVQLFGSRGVIEILTGHLPSVSLLQDPAWSPARSGRRWVPVTTAGINQPEVLPDGGLLAGNILACRDLMESIQEDRHPECSMYEGRWTVEMICGVFESHRVKKPVALPLENRVHPLSQL